MVALPSLKSVLIASACTATAAGGGIGMVAVINNAAQHSADNTAASPASSSPTDAQWRKLADVLNASNTDTDVGTASLDVPPRGRKQDQDADHAATSARLATNGDETEQDLFASDPRDTTPHDLPRAQVIEPTPTPNTTTPNGTRPAPLGQQGGPSSAGIAVNSASSGGGGGSSGLGFGGGGGGGGSSSNGSGGFGIAGNAPGLTGTSPQEQLLLETDPLEEQLALAFANEREFTSTTTTSDIPKPALITHADELTDTELDALIDDIKAGAWTMAPDGRLDETARLQNALDGGGDVVIQAGDWPTQPVKMTVDGTRVYVEDGASLNLLKTGALTHVLQVDADDCVIVGLDADGGGEDTPKHNGRHATLRINGNRNRIIDCNTDGSGRAGNKQWGWQSGIAVFGDQNLIENSTSHNAAYAGIFNLGDDNYFRGCKAYNYYYKGFNQGDNGRDLQRVTVNGWYSESNRGNGKIDIDKGGIYPIGLQVDTGERQLGEAILTDIRIGPHPDGIGGVKLATIDKATIQGLHVEDSHDFNRASLVLAEGLGRVVVNNGVLRRGVTQFPPKNHPQAVVQHLEITNVTLGGDQTINRSSMHDHLLVKDLIYRDCTFKGVGAIVFKAETPNDQIGTWTIDSCTFSSGQDNGEQSQIMFPMQSDKPPYELQTLNQSGKLAFINNTLQAPQGVEFVLSSKPFFAQLLKTTDSKASRYALDNIPADPRITWRTGDAATIGAQRGEFVCLEGGKPGRWVAAAWD